VINWHYHNFLLDNLEGRDDLQEIAQLHLAECMAIEQPNTTTPRS
jgi:hypothetical protein